MLAAVGVVSGFWVFSWVCRLMGGWLVGADTPTATNPDTDFDFPFAISLCHRTCRSSVRPGCLQLQSASSSSSSSRSRQGTSEYVEGSIQYCVHAAICYQQRARGWGLWIGAQLPASRGCIVNPSSIRITTSRFSIPRVGIMMKSVVDINEPPAQ